MYNSNQFIIERLGHYNINCIIKITVHIQIKCISIQIKFLTNTCVSIIHIFINTCSINTVQPVYIKALTKNVNCAHTINFACELDRVVELESK